MLTAKSIDTAQPKDKIYRLYDRDGLYIEISPSGGKWWWLKYRLRGKENRISLGTYPKITLKEARAKASEYREQVDKGLKPGVVRKYGEINLFKNIAADWYEKYSPSLTEKYSSDLWNRLETHALKTLGLMDITDIEPTDVLDCLLNLEKKAQTPQSINSNLI